MENVVTRKFVLDQFCAFFGHRVNASKSQVCFLGNTNITSRRLIGTY